LARQQYGSPCATDTPHMPAIILPRTSVGRYVRQALGNGPYARPTASSALTSVSSAISQSQAAGQVTTIWVGNLPADVSDHDLIQAFATFGTVMSASVSPKPAPASGLRSAFVRFAGRDAASLALAAAGLDQVAVRGRVAFCQWARTNSFGGTSGVDVARTTTVMASTDPLEAELQRLDREELQENMEEAWENEFVVKEEVDTIVKQAFSAAVHSGGRPVNGGEALATLWLGNLPPSCTDVDILAAFSQLGTVLVGIVHQRPSPLGSLSGFVRMSSRMEAMQAMAHCSTGNVEIHGAKVLAKWANQNTKIDSETMNVIPQPPVVPPKVRTLFIGSLPFNITEEEVRQGLHEQGLDGVISLNTTSRSSQGLSGFIRFDTPEAAQEAFAFMSQNPPMIRGQSIAFDWAKSDTFR